MIAYRFLALVTLALALGLFLSLSSTPSHAKIRITELISATEVAFESDEAIEVADHLPILDKDLDVLGYVKVTQFTPVSAGSKLFSGRGKVLYHLDNKLILPNFTLKKLSYYDTAPDPHFKGRADLQIQGKKLVSSRYKYLIDMGFTGLTAQTLDQGEYLVTVFGQVSWGITNDLTVSTNALLGVLGAPSISVKYKWIDNDFITLSPALSVAYLSPIQAYDSSLTLYARMTSNSKFISHTILSGRFSNLTTAQSITLASIPLFMTTALESGTVLLSSYFQSGYEYILDNWDRILLGPTYYFSNRALGGYAGYLFVWDHFHLGVGVQTANIFDLRFGLDAYLPTMTAYWRF